MKMTVKSKKLIVFAGLQLHSPLEKWRMPYNVKSTRYSLVKGERIIRYAPITRLRDLKIKDFVFYIVIVHFHYSDLLIRALTLCLDGTFQRYLEIEMFCI